MKNRKLLVSVLMLVCVLLSACAPATTPLSPTKVAQLVATSIPTVSTSVPTTIPTSPPSNTAVPTVSLPASDPNALAAVAGIYSYYGDYRVLLRSDGSFASLPSTGVYSVTSDEITFVDSLMAESGTFCGSQPGTYKWSLADNVLSFQPIQDGCSARAYIFSSNKFKKVLDDTSAPVEFVWRITGAPHAFVRPVNIAVDEQSNIYIVDGGNHRIQKFDMNGKFLKMWGQHGDGDGQFIFQVAPDHFGAVAVDSSGNVYVTDYNSRVQKFDSNGKFLMKWGTAGDDDGQFAVHSHMSIAVDASGNVYVSDTNNYCIQKFDANGKFLLKWGDNGNRNGQFGSSTDWNGPEGIAVDDQGNVYVADPANYRIQKFDANGNFLSQWGSQGAGDGQFLDAGSIAVDQHGYIYVTDNQQNVGGPTNQVSKFDSNGTFLLKWGETGPGLGMLNFPAGIAVDKQGNIYVVNVIENVQKFRPR
jgi:NHL repeat